MMRRLIALLKGRPVFPDDWLNMMKIRAMAKFFHCYPQLITQGARQPLPDGHSKTVLFRLEEGLTNMSAKQFAGDSLANGTLDHRVIRKRPAELHQTIVE